MSAWEHCYEDAYYLIERGPGGYRVRFDKGGFAGGEEWFSTVSCTSGNYNDALQLAEEHWHEVNEKRED